MLPRLTSIVLSSLLIASSACQTYTSGLQQTVARADETGAIAALRAITVAQRAYSLTNAGEYGSLKQLADGGFLDARFAAPNPVRDYVLTLNVIPKTSGAPEGSFSCNADPSAPGEKAGRHFYVDSTSNEIHVNDTQAATAMDKTVQ